MSDWAEITPSPVLAVQYPWNKHPHVYCVNCYGETHKDARVCRHCGIKFSQISTAASEPEWQHYVANLRPDLGFVRLSWG